MKKTTRKDFREFVKWCKYYIKKFGLTDYEFRFFHDDYDDKAIIACTDVDSIHAIANIWLYKSVKGIAIRNFRNHALHEILHVVTDPIIDKTWARLVNKDEIVAAVECVNARLINIVKDYEGRE